jgi:hypothetical protein
MAAYTCSVLGCRHASLVAAQLPHGICSVGGLRCADPGLVRNLRAKGVRAAARLSA